MRWTKLTSAWVEANLTVKLWRFRIAHKPQLYQQSSGAGIGLKSSACLAKLTMGLWDKYWSKIQLTWWLKTIMFIRYVDDIRIYCYPIKQGWYLSDMGWIFKNEEEDLRSPLERTEAEGAKIPRNYFYSPPRMLCQICSPSRIPRLEGLSTIITAF